MSLFFFLLRSRLKRWVNRSQCDGPYETTRNMNVRSRCLLILCGHSSAVLLCLLRFLLCAIRCELHANSAVDAASCANGSVCAFLYDRQQLFHEWVTIKDGRWCSEEVVAKGKGHARETRRRRRGRARRQPIRGQSVPLFSCVPVLRSGTALPPRGISWLPQGLFFLLNKCIRITTCFVCLFFFIRDCRKSTKIRLSEVKRYTQYPNMSNNKRITMKLY